MYKNVENRLGFCQKSPKKKITKILRDSQIYFVTWQITCYCERGRRARRVSERRLNVQRAHTHPHPFPRPPTLPIPRVPARIFPTGCSPPPSSRSGEEDQQRLQQEQAAPRTSASLSPMRLTAADDASREREGARARERKRETVAQRYLGRATDTARASIGSIRDSLLAPQ